jgi:precorrin-6B methylase 2
LIPSSFPFSPESHLLACAYFLINKNSLMEKQEITTRKITVDPSKIFQIGMGFWASKTLLTAVNTDLFTFLASGPKGADEIRRHLGFQERGFFDFLDALVALDFVQREGIKETSIYSNSADSDFFLDRNKPSYIGGMLTMANNRLYKFWDNLEEALKTGKPQNEGKITGHSLFKDLYADQNQLKEFLNAMAGVQMGNFIAFAQSFDFSPYSSLCDIGGAGGFLAAQVALHNPHMKTITFDLPPVEPVVKENLAHMHLADKVTVLSGDFFSDDFPRADVITMGNILHDWGLEDKKTLIRKAYNALPEGGVFVAIENIIDENRSQNAFGLMASLNMLIETEAGFDYTTKDFEEWAQEAGFKRIEVIPLTGPTSAAIAYK